MKSSHIKCLNQMCHRPSRHTVKYSTVVSMPLSNLVTRLLNFLSARAVGSRGSNMNHACMRGHEAWFECGMILECTHACVLEYGTVQCSALKQQFVRPSDTIMDAIRRPRFRGSVCVYSCTHTCVHAHSVGTGNRYSLYPRTYCSTVALVGSAS